MIKLTNPHVGEILKHEFIDELGISQNQLAQAISVPANRIHHIVRGERRITADTDLRLCKYFSLSEGYFLRLQILYELMESKRKLEGDGFKRIIPHNLKHNLPSAPHISKVML